MAFKEEDFLQLSGLQHFRFCRRQWALIHIEHLWAENFRTVDGALMHAHAHDKGFSERRGDLLITRGMNVHSSTLGISGTCDVLEFHANLNGVPLTGHEGFWQPYPVEYKRGMPNEHNSDALQLCAQAMCLEEMLCCTIAEGALYYGQTHRRTTVPFTETLRQQVRESLAEMHQLFQRGHTPKSKPTKACNACSLKELCLPAMLRGKTVSSYLAKAMEDAP